MLDAGAVDSVADAADGAVGRIENNAADCVSTIFGQSTNVAGHIATALLNLDLHFKLAVVGKRGNDVIGVDDFNVVRQLDIGGQHNAGALLAQHQRDVFTIVQLENHALQIQKDVDDVFAHTGNGGVLVYNTGHLHFGGGVTGHGRQQDTAQGVTQRMAVTAFEGFHDNLGAILAQGFDFDGAGFQKTLRRHVYSFINTLGSLHR